MKKFVYLLSLLLTIGLTACESNTPSGPTEPVVVKKVETGISENITQTSVTLKGQVNVDISLYKDIEFGIMYGTNAEDINHGSAQSVSGDFLLGNDFAVHVTYLTDETKYYYCAYILLNDLQFVFGEIKEFTTLPYSENANNHAYVDLGLSVKWATMNVGANSPEEYGDYFAWGEIQPKEAYNWSSYKWCNGTRNLQIKYCTSTNYGFVDDKIELERNDDIAIVNWGGAWRMPTANEQYELCKECTWTWTTQNGVNGYKVTSKKNNNSIFLPTNGFRSGSKLYEEGESGYYWSSSLNDGYPDLAYCININSAGVQYEDAYRRDGHAIRPVLP